MDPHISNLCCSIVHCILLQWCCSNAIDYRQAVTPKIRDWYTPGFFQWSYNRYLLNMNHMSLCSRDNYSPSLHKAHILAQCFSNPFLFCTLYIYSNIKPNILFPFYLWPYSHNTLYLLLSQYSSHWTVITDVLVCFPNQTEVPWGQEPNVLQLYISTAQNNYLALKIYSTNVVWMNAWIKCMNK